MRVLFVSHSAELTGAPISCYHMIERLSGGLEATFASPRRGPLWERLGRLGVPCHVVPRKGPLGLRYVLSFIRIIRAERTRLLSLNTLTPFSKYAAIAGYLTGVPVVWFVRENPLISRSRRLRFWLRLLANRIIFVDNMTRTQLFPGGAPAKTDTLYNGVDLEVFSRSEGGTLRRELGVGRDVPVVGYVGLLTKRKGLAFLLEALPVLRERFAEVQLVLIGGPGTHDEEYYAELQQRVAELAVTECVHFVGQLEDVRPAIEDLDIVVLPSLEERCSRTLLEAMALEKPVVATAVGGTPELVVDGKTGILVEPASPEALALGLGRLLGDADLRIRMGRAGRRRTEEIFDVRENARKVDVMFREVLKR